MASRTCRSPLAGPAVNGRARNGGPRSWGFAGPVDVSIVGRLGPAGTPQSRSRHQAPAALGPGKLAAYKAGRITLQDLAGFRHDPVCGPVGYERSLKSLGHPGGQSRRTGGQGSSGGGTSGGRGGSGGAGAPGGGKPPGEDPTDAFIRQLIREGREPTGPAVGRILARVGDAPFSREPIRVPARLRGVSYGGRTLGPRADSLTFHLAKRVLVEQQWAAGTTAGQYVADLRRAVRHWEARLALYRQAPDRSIVAVLAPTAGAVPAARLGPRPEAHVLVVYEAERGMILTGYQVSGLAATSVPSTVTWRTRPPEPPSTRTTSTSS